MIESGTTPSARGPRRRRAIPGRARPSGASSRLRNASLESRRATILIASWALVIPATYFVLGEDAPAVSEAGAGATLLALVVVNFILGWLQPQTVVAPQYGVPFALLQMVLLTATWWLSGQAAIEVLTFAAAFLWLAVVGLSLAELSAAALAMIAVYLVLI